MEQHGGGIEITSEPGRGTRALLWLPLCGTQKAAA
jgi:signal transduction histidine kinase